MGKIHMNWDKTKLKDMVDTVKMLNNLLTIDCHAIQELLYFRVPCNEDLANHSYVQVLEGDGTFIRKGEFRLGVLGLINGLLLADKRAIAACYSDSGMLTHFKIVDI
jgi:hypothetical protein